MTAESMPVSVVAAKVAQDRDWLLRQRNVEQMIDGLQFDGEIPALDIESSLRDRERYRLALRLLDRIRHAYPNGDLALYRTSLNAAGLHEYDDAIRYARQAIARSPNNIEYRSCLIRSCALAGRHSEAIDAICTTSATTKFEIDYLTQLTQFVDYCEKFPINTSRDALGRFQDSGSYSEAQGVKDILLAAIRSKRPFSMVRLGDGEGAWLHLNSYDEGRYSNLYRQNRISFLNDWFGSDKLIDDMDFRRFALDLQAEFVGHDLVGLPPPARLDQEQGFMSMRGIPSSTNAFRFVKGLEETSSTRKFCSNSVNLDLAFHTDFYQEIFRNVQRIGLITSQTRLQGLFQNIGIEIICNHIIPGDSRNYHRDEHGQLLCQYPAFVRRIDDELSVSVSPGEVYFVAAGFVGKKYLSTIRRRGGIAIDLGSLADHWARHGLPT